MTRLTTLDTLPTSVHVPGYSPAAHGVGMVHLGLGAFHRTHQAVYTDDALGVSGGDWRIAGVSLRSPQPAQELTPQHGLYTVISRSAQGSEARVIGALAHAWHLGHDRHRVLAALTDPATRIVSLTVTEKGYGLDRATGGIDRAHPTIAADLADPDQPQGVAGLLVWALKQRRQAGTPPFTVLCCDNLPENGPLLRGLLIDFARQAAPEIADHIATDVAFPATMVDRITPARTEATLALAREMTGHEDAAALETEAFRQWVIEDRFPTGRPSWEAGGAIFVDDVRPYEHMKLRMLNGAHSMLAYAGFLCGHAHVRDVMRDPALVTLIRRHLDAAAATLPALPGVDFDSYAAELLDRFDNPHLAHETYQIAMDGSEKMPQRIFAPAADALAAGQPLDAFAFATAAWLRYLQGRTDDGTPYALRDPREDQLRAALEGAEDAGTLVSRLLALPGLCPTPLRDSEDWRAAVRAPLAVMLERGSAPAVAEAAAAPSAVSIGPGREPGRQSVRRRRTSA